MLEYLARIDMKRILFVLPLLLSGCVTADGAGASVGTGAGSAIKGVGTFFHSAFVNLKDHIKQTDAELAEAQHQCEALTARKIACDVKTVKVSSTEDGVTRSRVELDNFAVKSVVADAVSAVALTAHKSAFDGVIVLVADAGKQAHIRDDIEQIVGRDGVQIVTYTPQETGKKAGIVWVPKHINKKES